MIELLLFEQKIDKEEETTDWSAPTVIPNDELELKWSDDDEEKEEEEGDFKSDANPAKQTTADDAPESKELCKTQTVDFIAQHLKFIAILRIMMDEMSTLASGFEIDGGQLRFELFKWLESECSVLHEICDFQIDETPGLNYGDEEMSELVEDSVSFTGMFEESYVG